jgi:HSP20 family protein
MFGTLTDLEGSLFSQFRRLEEEMDELLGGWTPAAIRSVARGTFPPINVGMTPDKVEVYVFAPGLDPKAVDVSIQQNLLTISGKREVAIEENARYYRKERFSGDFRRVVALPEDVAAERTEATYRDGILQVGVARKESARPRQIDVKVA